MNNASIRVGILLLIVLLLPRTSYAQYMSGGGYTVHGQVNPITGMTASGNFTIQGGGAPSHGDTGTGNGYVLQGGSFLDHMRIIPPVSPASSSTSSGSYTSYSPSQTLSYTLIGTQSPDLRFLAHLPQGASAPHDGTSVGTMGTYVACNTEPLYVPKTPIRLGRSNDPVDVLRLQRFLNTFEGFSLAEDSVYKQADFDAVVIFQRRHIREILDPWQITEGTGYVSITTLRYLNSLFRYQCKGIALQPLTALSLTNDITPHIQKNLISSVAQFIPRIVPLYPHIQTWRVPSIDRLGATVEKAVFRGLDVLQEMKTIFQRLQIRMLAAFRIP